MNAYREQQVHEGFPLVDRVRTEEEWRLMKRIASDECKQRRTRARLVAVAVAAAGVIAACVLAATNPSPAHVAAAWVTVPVLILAVTGGMMMHGEGDNDAGNLAAAKVDLQRERSR
jgi:fatty acid desaturase